MKNDYISVIIPVYNSYYSIEEVVERIFEILNQEELRFEIILVDDFSTDNSSIKLKELNKKDVKIKTISLTKNYGQQGAIKYGMNMANGNLIITMDDDLEHQPEDIMLLIKEIKKGYDVVYAIPNNKKYPFYRKLGSRLVDAFFTLCLHKPKNIKVSSFRIIDQEIVGKVLQDETPYVYITAIILKFTKKIGNVYVNHVDRKYGKSNYNIRKLISLFTKLFFYYGVKTNKKSDG
ncbi:MAG: glycosyltransferase family 2 protein [Eubacteriaceae bacterium]